MPRESRVVYPINTKPKRPFPRKVLFSLLVSVSLVAIGIGVGYVLNLPYLRLNQIEVRGVRLLPVAEVEQAVGEVLNGAWWRILPRNNFFLVSGGTIEHRLRERFSAIDRVNVDRRFPDRLIVTITERTLWGVYCERVGPGDPAPACFYVDAYGTAYEPLSSFAGWLLPVVYAPVPVSAGAAAVAPSVLVFFNSAKAAIASIGGQLLSLTLSTSTPEDVRLSLAEGWYLVVSADQPVDEWRGVLDTLLAKDVGARRRELEYVDLRFGKKVFYKYRD